MRYWFYYLTKFLLWVTFRLGFGLDVHGQEHVPRHGGCLLACNHVSYLDPPVVGVACPRPVGFMARATLFEHPLLAAFMRGTLVIPLQRGEGDLQAIREAVDRLRQGEVVAVFPEGGRQPSGRLGVAKRGIGVIATSAQVNIIPVVIQGTFDALPPNAHRLHRTKIRVAFGPPIPYTMPPSPSEPDRSAEWQDRREVLARRQRHQVLADAVTRSWQALVEPRKDAGCPSNP